MVWGKRGKIFSGFMKISLQICSAEDQGEWRTYPELPKREGRILFRGWEFQEHASSCKGSFGRGDWGGECSGNALKWTISRRDLVIVDLANLFNEK